MAFRKTILALTATCFLGLGLTSTASATVIGTQDFLAAKAASTSATGDLARVRAALQRSDVQQQLQALGVSPAQAEARVAALTDQELASMADGLEQLPAGGDGLGLIGAVFVVLLILELTGVIDIFKKI
jgi:hypothetical protein